MQHRPYSYLFFLQFLGLRYAGWQKQKGIKTVQGTIERGIRYVLGHEDFTTLGASRTDSGVSCEKGAFQLFLKTPLPPSDFLENVNLNLPSDIRLLSLRPVPSTFNIIQEIAWKEYHYHMAFDEKFHPFAAGNLTFFAGKPDLDLMYRGAQSFKGMHDFRQFCSIDKLTDNFVRKIFLSEVLHHPQAGRGYIPKNALVFKVRGDGFLRYQVRIMANALVELGLGKISLETLSEALQGKVQMPISKHAAPNGLVLHDLTFKGL